MRYQCFFSIPTVSAELGLPSHRFPTVSLQHVNSEWKKAVVKVHFSFSERMPGMRHLECEVERHQSLHLGDQSLCSVRFKHFFSKHMRQPRIHLCSLGCCSRVVRACACVCACVRMCVCFLAAEGLEEGVMVLLMTYGLRLWRNGLLLFRPQPAICCELFAFHLTLILTT